MGRTTIIDITMEYARNLTPRPFFQYTFQGNCSILDPNEYGNFNGRPGPVSGIRSIINRWLKPVQNYV